MRKTFTTDDLIRFIYRETTDREDLEIVELLAADPLFLEQYREMAGTVSALEKFSMEPDPTSIRIVMEYSASLQEKTIH